MTHTLEGQALFALWFGFVIGVGIGLFAGFAVFWYSRYWSGYQKGFRDADDLRIDR